MKILLFGKDGQLGKAFKELFDALSPALEVQIQFVGREDCDLSDENSLNHLLEIAKPHLIINTAAYTAVDKAETEVNLANAINARAPELMAIYATKYGATLLHYSSDYVFDGKKEGAYLESDERRPLGAYGRSKLAGELAIENAFLKSTAGRYAILRTSWVYGNGANFIRTILRLAKEREQLKVIHDQYGVPTSAQWLAQISVDLALERDLNLRAFPSGIYHAVPNGEVTWYEFACLAVETAMTHHVALKTNIQSISPILSLDYPLPAPRPKNSRLNNEKLHSLIAQMDDVTKLQHWNRSWSDGVRTYVGKLAQDGLI